MQWSVFSRILTKYGEILRSSPYSVRMCEKMEQKNSEYKHFSQISKTWVPFKWSLYVSVSHVDCVSCIRGHYSHILLEFYSWKMQQTPQNNTFFFIRTRKIDLRLCARISSSYSSYIYMWVKFRKSRKKDILPVAVTFCRDQKTIFTKLVRELICTIEKFKILNRIKFPEICELAVN